MTAQNIWKLESEQKCEEQTSQYQHIVKNKINSQIWVSDSWLSGELLITIMCVCVWEREIQRDKKQKFKLTTSYLKIFSMSFLLVKIILRAHSIWEISTHCPIHKKNFKL